MIQVIAGTDTHLYPDLFEQIHRLRHKVFVEEMGWEELRSPDGREIDQFDTDHAVHHVAVRNGIVAGYQRLLPTIHPHLFSSELRNFCAEAPPVGGTIWEVTRYCVAPAFREGRRAVNTVGSELLAATVEWAEDEGVLRLLYAFEISWVARAIQLGFRVRSLGFPVQVANQTVVAAELIHRPETLVSIRRYRDHFEPVIEYAGKASAKTPRQTAHDAA